MNKLLKRAKQDPTFRRQLLVKLSSHEGRFRPAIIVKIKNTQVLDAGHSIKVFGDFILYSKVCPFVFILELDEKNGFVVVSRNSKNSLLDSLLFEDFIEGNMDIAEFLSNKLFE